MNFEPPFIQLGYDVKKRLHSNLKLCLKSSEVYNCLRPRVYTYLAFVKSLQVSKRCHRA